ncbi:Uncharacterised protein [Bordetella hinzii]|uniref:hypothetical protein n=1 Tax=Bordetella hinzii TaxID=103855 RepID=UPI0003F91504|nr:hypothetical protein [Bordetella hinzii]AKQ55138.1 hypothetical protein ACR54_01818 [Bordetella hinzii]KCB26641.1 hypothetical protein L543_1361 [Bordetella hinzii L60]SNV92439.1 Uncharacterised protein [Bordetella hinzii]
MNEQNNAAQRVLTDDEIRAVWIEHGLDDEAVEDFARAIESALLSKLRAPVADERALPPLPAAWGSAINDAGDGHVDLYSAEQLQDYARAALASAPVADGEWSTLSDLHLQALMFAYNEGYSKAIDGRKFKNPFETSGSQAAAWELGTQDGTEARSKMESAPVAGEAIAWLSDAGLESLRRFGQASVVGSGARSDSSEFKHPLYAAPQASEAVRDAALKRACSLREVTCKKCGLQVISSCRGDGCPVKDRYPDLRALSAQPGARK